MLWTRRPQSFFDRQFHKYVFEGEGEIRSTEEMIDYYEGLAESFPIVSIEDPLDEEDWEGWELLTTRLGMHMQLVGDDLFVTNTGRLKKGIEKGRCQCNPGKGKSDRNSDRGL